MVRFSSISEGPLRQCLCLDVRPFKGKRSFLGVLSKMILWTCLGLGTAVSQHTLYEYLNNQPTHRQLPFANNILSFQQVINAAGNAMSLIVNMSFQAAICLFFVQHFWSQIRRRSFTAKEINAIIDMQGNPLSFHALSIFSSAFQLFVIALIIFSLSVVSIVVPGSLTVVQGNFNQKQTCNVPTTQYPYAPALLARTIALPVAATASLALPYHLFRKSRPKSSFLDHIYHLQPLVAHWHANTTSPSTHPPSNVIARLP
jgi:hypothetical protein